MASPYGQPAQTGAPMGQTGAAPAAAGDGQGDALDKGLKSIAGKFGFGAKVSNANIEKASDGIRGLFKKATGKDVPIADKQMR